MKKLLLISIALILCLASVAWGVRTTKVYFDKGGDRMTVASGGTLVLASGSTFTVADGSIAAGDIALADTKLIIGGATGVGAEKSMSGDATIANTGALTIATGAVEDSMIEGLADGEFIIGVDGTAANNAKVTASGDATISNAGVVDVASTFVQNLRERVTVANINAGYELLAAVAGKRYRMVDVFVTAIGGTCDNATSVDIVGVQSTSDVNLVTYAVAALVDDALVRVGAANADDLANGLSFVSNDANTAITIQKSSGNIVETCTEVDVILSYVIE
jgi:hypothetical protein